MRIRVASADFVQAFGAGDDGVDVGAGTRLIKQHLNNFIVEGRLANGSARRGALVRVHHVRLHADGVHHAAGEITPLVPLQPRNRQIFNQISLFGVARIRVWGEEAMVDIRLRHLL